MKNVSKIFVLLLLMFNLICNRAYSGMECSTSCKRLYPEKILSIGEIYEVKGEEKSCVWHEYDNDIFLAEENCHLFKNDKVNVNQDSQLTLSFPSCKDEIVRLFICPETYITLKEVSSHVMEQGKALYDVKKGGMTNVVEKGKTYNLHIETKRVHIWVIASTFIVEESEKYTIVTTSKDTYLDIRIKNPNKPYHITELQQVIFEDGMEPYTRNISGDDFKEMMGEIIKFSFHKTPPSSSARHTFLPPVPANNGNADDSGFSLIQQLYPK